MTEKRICMCGSLFIPVDEAHDNLCKRCLLREYLALRARLEEQSDGLKRLVENRKV